MDLGFIYAVCGIMYFATEWRPLQTCVERRDFNHWVAGWYGFWIVVAWPIFLAVRLRLRWLTGKWD